MNGEPLTIGQIIAEIIARMKEAGYEERTLSAYYRSRFLCIAAYYRKNGLVYYDPAVTKEYIDFQEERVSRNEISKEYLKRLKIGANKLDEFYITGTVHVTTNEHGTKYDILPENERLADMFIKYRGYGPNTRDDVLWVIRRYLHYLEKNGHESFLTVTIDDVRKYVIETAADVKLSSLHNILLYMKYFHRFLKETNIPAPDCESILSYKICREMPIQSYVSDIELSMILNQIDRSTVKGKRNYAIIMLAATTGIRAADIIHLKLEDIDWKKGEIRIAQTKTDKTTVVPLVKETGEALEDYILNGRPKSVFPEVFLRLASPTVPIMDAASIGDMFGSYQKAAGITRQAFDGKGFHGLRRGFAKKLLVAGSSVEMVAQILGHTNTDSARQYLSLDSSNIKECALSFEGIPYRKAVYSYE